MRTRETVGKLALAAALLVLAGCAMKAPVSGFAPVYPELTWSSNMWYSMDVLDWAKVDSLQPTLRWGPFPGTHQAFVGGGIKPFMDVNLESVRDVTYDVKIWTVVNRVPAELTYEREGLTEPSHRLERPFKPDAEYYWSVRARFTLNGKPRATEWSLSSIPCPPPYGLECARGEARRTGVIPPLNHYRFKTPPR